MGVNKKNKKPAPKGAKKLAMKKPKKKNGMGGMGSKRPYGS